MLASVYSISQAMSPMQKVTQVVEVQTSAPASCNLQVILKRKQSPKKQETTQKAPTTGSVTQKQVVTEEEKNAKRSRKCY